MNPQPRLLISDFLAPLLALFYLINWTGGGGGGLDYSKVSIKRLVLLKDLIWVFPKSLSKDQVHIRKKLSYCFISGPPRPIFGLYQTTWSEYLDEVSIKQPVLSIFQILEA